MDQQRNQRLNKGSQYLFIFILLTLFLGLAACKKDPQSIDPAARPPRELTKDDEGNFKYTGGVAVLGITQEPDKLDPHRAISAGTKELLFNVYEGLFKLNSKGKFARCLVSEYELSEDKLEIILHLKEHLYFHDGSEVTAEDVLYSHQRALGDDSTPAWSSSLSNMNLERIDDKNLKISFQTFDPHLFSSLTFPIVKKDAVDEYGRPIGTGPFILADYLPQDRLILKNFPLYHKEPAYLDEVHVLILADRDAASFDLKSGQIDIFPYLGAEMIQELEEHYKMIHGSANMVQLLALNNLDPVLKDEEVRYAINSAIDRYGLVDLIGNGYGRILYSGLSPALKDSFNSDLNENSLLSISEARAIINEKYPAGLTVSCKVPANYLIHVNTAEVLAAQLKAINVSLSIERVDWLTWLEEVYQNRNYQSTIIALTFDEFNETCVLERYQSDAGNNFINFSDSTYDQTLQKALLTEDDATRNEEYKRLQAILLERSASCFLQDPESITAVRKVLSGYVQYPAYVQDLSLVYYIDEEAMEQSKVR